MWTAQNHRRRQNARHGQRASLLNVNVKNAILKQTGKMTMVRLDFGESDDERERSTERSG